MLIAATLFPPKLISSSTSDKIGYLSRSGFLKSKFKLSKSKLPTEESFLSGKVNAY